MPSMKLFNNPFILKEQEFYVTASTGISLYPGGGDDIEGLLNKEINVAAASPRNKSFKYIDLNEFISYNKLV